VAHEANKGCIISFGKNRFQLFGSGEAVITDLGGIGSIINLTFARTLPVAIMSSIPNTPRSEELLRHGARDIIIKPLDILLLQEKCLQYFIPSSS
jgi:hypothetical protein